MAGPPKDVPAGVLVQKLSETPRPSEVVDFPRYNEDGEPVAQVRIRVLHEHERQRAMKAALDWCKDKQGLTKQDLDTEIVQSGIYGAAIVREMVAMACVSVAPIEGSENTPGGVQYRREFANGQQVDENLTQNELATLFGAYTIIQNKFGPTANSIETDDELNAWIKRIVEGASAAPLAYRDSSQLVDLLTLLTARAYALSLILESLSSTLPDTLRSELETWGIGTGYFSSQPDDDTDDRSSTGSQAPGTRLLLPPGDEPIDLNQAKKFARKLLENG